MDPDEFKGDEDPLKSLLPEIKHLKGRNDNLMPINNTREFIVKKPMLFLLLTALSFSTLADSELIQEDLIAKAKAFVSARNARQQPGATAKDIDHYLSLLADNFVDEHVKYQFTFTDKTQLRESMLNKLKDKVFYSDILIDEMMLGSNVAFIKMIETGKVKPSHLEKEIEYHTINIVSLEFDDKGLIKHIRRHHAYE